MYPVSRSRKARMSYQACAKHSLKMYSCYWPVCILYFSRDFPFRSGSTLKKPQGVGRQFSSLFRRLYLSFRSKPLTHYAICRPMLSTTWWPKPKTSLVGHNCPKFSISSTKELVRFFFHKCLQCGNEITLRYTVVSYFSTPVRYFVCTLYLSCDARICGQIVIQH